MSGAGTQRLAEEGLETLAALKAQLTLQEVRLNTLRGGEGQQTSSDIDNEALISSKKLELAAALTKVNELTSQLEQLCQGQSPNSLSPSDTPSRNFISGRNPCSGNGSATSLESGSSTGSQSKPYNVGQTGRKTNLGRSKSSGSEKERPEIITIRPQSVCDWTKGQPIPVVHVDESLRGRMVLDGGLDNDNRKPVIGQGDKIKDVLERARDLNISVQDGVLNESLTTSKPKSTSPASSIIRYLKVNFLPGANVESKNSHNVSLQDESKPSKQQKHEKQSASKDDKLKSGSNSNGNIISNSNGKSVNNGGDACVSANDKKDNKQSTNAKRLTINDMLFDSGRKTRESRPSRPNIVHTGSVDVVEERLDRNNFQQKEIINERLVGEPQQQQQQQQQQQYSRDDSPPPGMFRRSASAGYGLSHQINHPVSHPVSHQMSHSMSHDKDQGSAAGIQMSLSSPAVDGINCSFRGPRSPERTRSITRQDILADRARFLGDFSAPATESRGWGDRGKISGRSQNDVKRNSDDGRFSSPRDYTRTGQTVSFILGDTAGALPRPPPPDVRATARSHFVARSRSITSTDEALSAPERQRATGAQMMSKFAPRPYLRSKSIDTTSSGRKPLSLGAGDIDIDPVASSVSSHAATGSDLVKLRQDSLRSSETAPKSEFNVGDRIVRHTDEGVKSAEIVNKSVILSNYKPDRNLASVDTTVYQRSDSQKTGSSLISGARLSGADRSQGEGHNIGQGLISRSNEPKGQGRGHTAVPSNVATSTISSSANRIPVSSVLMTSSSAVSTASLSSSTLTAKPTSAPSRPRVAPRPSVPPPSVPSSLPNKLAESITVIPFTPITHTTIYSTSSTITPISTVIVTSIVTVSTCASRAPSASESLAVKLPKSAICSSSSVTSPSLASSTAGLTQPAEASSRPAVRHTTTLSSSGAVKPIVAAKPCLKPDALKSQGTTSSSVSNKTQTVYRMAPSVPARSPTTVLSSSGGKTGELSTVESSTSTLSTTSASSSSSASAQLLLSSTPAVSLVPSKPVSTVSLITSTSFASSSSSSSIVLSSSNKNTLSAVSTSIPVAAASTSTCSTTSTVSTTGSVVPSTQQSTKHSKINVLSYSLKPSDIAQNNKLLTNEHLNKNLLNNSIKTSHSSTVSTTCSTVLQQPSMLQNAQIAEPTVITTSPVSKSNTIVSHSNATCSTHSAVNPTSIYSLVSTSTITTPATVSSTTIATTTTTVQLVTTLSTTTPSSSIVETVSSKPDVSKSNASSHSNVDSALNFLLTTTSSFTSSSQPITISRGYTPRTVSTSAYRARLSDTTLEQYQSSLARIYGASAAPSDVSPLSVFNTERSTDGTAKSLDGTSRLTDGTSRSLDGTVGSSLSFPNSKDGKDEISQEFKISSATEIGNVDSPQRARRRCITPPPPTRAADDLEASGGLETTEVECSIVEGVPAQRASLVDLSSEYDTSSMSGDDSSGPSSPFRPPEGGSSQFKVPQAEPASPFRPPDDVVTSFIDDLSPTSGTVPCSSSQSDGRFQSGMMSLLFNPHQSRQAVPSYRVVTSEGEEESKPVKSIRKRERSSSMGARRRVTFDPLSLLLNASAEGDLEVVMSVIPRLPNPNQCIGNRFTALHTAICNGRTNVARFLIEYGCDVNALDMDGWTPLHCAASCNNPELVDQLIRRGASLYSTTHGENETPTEKCSKTLTASDLSAECLQILQDSCEALGVDCDGLVYACWSYEAVNLDELTFSAGDRLKVVSRSDTEGGEDWWVAKRGDKQGYVPRGYLALYPRIECKWMKNSPSQSLNEKDL